VCSSVVWLKRGWDMQNAYSKGKILVLVGKPQEERTSETCVGGRIILERIFKK
jgi:hypothetical protein